MPSGNWSFPCSPRNPAKAREELRLLRTLVPGWRARGLAWSSRSGTQLEFGRHLRASSELPAGPDADDGEDLRFRRQATHLSDDNLRWTARARFGTYRFFGFVMTDDAGLAALTPAGERFVDAARPGDVLLRQLLKWQYPDYQHHGARWPASEFAIYPFVATARLIDELDGLTREEIALFCFTMRRTEDAAATSEQIRQYRDRRERAPGRVGRARVARAALTAAQHRYAIDGWRVAGSTNDYADALIRYFRYTNLFSVRGARLVVASGREDDLLELVYADPAAARSAAVQRPSRQLALGEAPPVSLAEPRPLFADYEGHAAFHAHYGDASAPKLPWEDPARLAAQARTLDEHVAALRVREAHLRSGRLVLSGATTTAGLTADRLERRLDALRAERQRLERSIFAIESRTPRRLEEALDAYGAIVRREVIDPPTYLEWNTWRVFLALNAAREIVPALQLDDDLQPLNPAQGNQPDLTVDYGDFLVVTEVTLRTGADQRQAEARPVTRHVLEAQRRYNDPFGGRPERPVFGLFLAPRIHPDTANDFFIALKFRVIERQQVVAIPLTTRQFAAALRPFAGGTGAARGADDGGAVARRTRPQPVEFQPARLRRLLEACVAAGLVSETGDEWLEGIDTALRTWLAALGAPFVAGAPVERPMPLPLF